MIVAKLILTHLMGELIDPDQIEIEITLKDHPTIAAMVKLRYGCLEISGYRIMRSKYEDGYYVQDPKILRGNRKPLTIVWFTDPDVWETLKRRILHEFRKLIAQDSEAMDDRPLDEISVDDIST